MKHIKCVVVGAEHVGKTSYLITYTTRTYPAEYVPIFDNYSANIMVDDQPINLQLWDTSGSHEYKKLRPLNYPQTDVFIYCISLVEPKTLDEVISLWSPETKDYCPTAQRILVGLKSDIREEMLTNPDLRAKYSAEGYEPIPTSKGEELKEEIGASCYIECSAKNDINIKHSFEEAVRTVLKPSSPKKVEKKKSGKFHLFSKSKKSDDDKKEKKHKDSDDKKEKKHKDSDDKKEKKHKDSDDKKEKKHKDSDHKKGKKS